MTHHMTAAASLADQLLSRLELGTARVCVVGLGYVGLPLAETFAAGGYPVTGFDIDPEKVRKLQAGQSYIGHIDSERVAELVGTGRFTATSDPACFAQADAIVICVPTPLTETREPDLSYIIKTGETIRPHLRPGQLIVLESTTYPGTTEELLRPLLEQSGLQAGRDFFLAFSPEREDPGNPDYSTRTIPKVVGGVNETSRRLAVALYTPVVTGVVPVSSTQVAEACKILENTYRAVNIALVNELKVVFDKMGVDVWEVIAAARTKPFGFQAFYPGPGLGGHCLAGEEIVCVRDADGVHVLRFEDLFSRFASLAGRLVNGVEVAEVQGLDALSVDPESGQTCFARVTHLFRRPCQSPLLRLRLKDNRQLSVTDGHPMLVHNGFGIEVRTAADVEAGDHLVVMSSWPDVTPAALQIDLVDMAWRHALKGVRVLPRTGDWQTYDALVRPALEGTGVAVKDVYRHNTLPLAVYLRLEREGTVPFPRSQVLLTTGKGRSWNPVPALLPLDEDFARLIGYYLSEGCLTNDGALRTRLCFGSHERELIEDATAILTRFGFRHSVHRLKSCATVHIKISSRLLGILLRDVLGCGVRSEDARIPARLLAAPESVRRALLAGLLRGDGDVYLESRLRPYQKNGRAYCHRLHAATAGYFTSSPILLQQVTLLLQGLGWMPTFHRNRPHLRLHGQQVESLEPLLVGAKQAKVGAYRQGRTRAARPRAYQQHDGFATVPVAAIEPVEGTAVYSLEVAGTHTFVTSFGIAVHNCIPIDPFYLTWAARKYGLHTRFIELAGEVNTGMPQYVVHKVAAALNEDGKPVKGSRVCVLGVAYKKDVDDPRESPAFEILELLERQGAVLAYHDPHVPRLPPMRHHHIRLASQPLTEAFLAEQDCVIVVTDHSACDYALLARAARLIVDTRNALAGVPRPRARIVKA